MLRDCSHRDYLSGTGETRAFCEAVGAKSSSARTISSATLSMSAKLRFFSSLKTRSRKHVADSVSIRLNGARPGWSPTRKSVRNTMTGFFRYAYPHSQEVPESGSGPSILATITSAQSTPSTSFSKICLADMDRCSDSCGNHTLCPAACSRSASSLLNARSATENNGPARYIFMCHLRRLHLALILFDVDILEFSHSLFH